MPASTPYSRIRMLLPVLLACLPALPLAAQQTPVAVDHENSHIVVITGRAGALRFMAHDHAMVAQEWKADLALDRDNPAASRVQITVRTASMRVGSPELHEEMGLSQGVPSQDDIRDIERKMTGERILHSQSHPEIRFQATKIERRNENTFTVTGPLTLRGTTREVSFPVEMEQTAEGLAFSGSFEVSQRDFGIKPESLAAGLVRVADAVEVRFRISASPSRP